MILRFLARDKRSLPFYKNTLTETGCCSDDVGFYQDMEDGATRERTCDRYLAAWVPELVPMRWSVINLLCSIVYAVPLVALLWRDKSHFYYTQTFYLTVNICSCVVWVVQSALSAYWFWGHLGLLRVIELSLALYFVVDSVMVILHRDTQQLSIMDIIIDYGISLAAYLWALEMSLKELRKSLEQDEKLTEISSPDSRNEQENDMVNETSEG
jgi:hypothetical protein